VVVVLGCMCPRLSNNNNVAILDDYRARTKVIEKKEKYTDLCIRV